MSEASKFWTIGKMRHPRFAVGLLLVLGVLMGPFFYFGGKGEARDPATGVGQTLLFTDRDNFYSVDAVDKDHVWIVGYWGKILHSANGGKTWQIQKSPTRDPLFSVSFGDPQHGVITGRDGALLYTESSGQTWQALNSPKKVHLISVTHSDPLNVWAVGDFGTILHSDDGGKTWKDESLTEDTILNKVYFFDAQHGWIVGEFGKILHTADGGQTWTPQINISGVYKDPEVDQFGVYLYDIGFSDLQHGWAVGQAGTVLYTEDGGGNWANTPTRNTQTLFGIAQGKEQAFAVGAVGTVLSSHASPADPWELRGDIVVYTWLRNISFAPGSDIGWAVGGRGAILKTEDSGKKWTVLSASEIEVK